MHASPTLRRLGTALFATLAFGAVAMPASATTTILFIGNSFTYGEPTAGVAPTVQYYQPTTVTDLNGSGIGGVPALFKGMTVQAGLDYKVSLETIPGVGLDTHYNTKLGTILAPYDKVVMQSYSTLDAAKPGDPAKLIQYSGLLAQAFHDLNPDVNILLDATWSRADLTYRTNSPWLGQSIFQMALDIRKGYDAADAASDLIDGVIPVGQAWNRAIAGGLADANPYDGIGDGQINLWAPENYHASPYGYYLEALTMFGSITGLDPSSLGANDTVARDLGISAANAAALQRFASAQLAAEVPEPGTVAMFLTLGGLMCVARRRKSPRG
ncbi:MAG: PEP-CTERM sorting domain-containing protein [Oxalobacteraceae bacterium]|nr:MAG: PEP-CTERM sorting domain-containing protein [Oxalobacteraceae bacterium]